MKKIWNEDEIAILKDLYPTTDTEIILKNLPLKHKLQILDKAKELKLNKEFGFYKKWTKEQIDFLIENYENQKTDFLIAHLKNKTNDQIRWKAKEFKLIKKVTKSKKDLSFLENLDNKENCYWWGVLLADGCFTESQLILSFGIKDKDHLQKFADKINTKISTVFRVNDWNPKGYYMSRVAASDKLILARIRERFSIVNKKTYTPFNIDEFLTKERILYFLAGIVDGDGTISLGGNFIGIKCHSNWLDKFSQLSVALEDFFQIKAKVKINKEGWLQFSINTKEQCQKIKSLLNKEVPLLARKWDRISDLTPLN